GVAHGDGRLHGAQRLDEFVVLVLRLVEQDVDADRLRTHRVEVAQRAGQQAAVQRGALARVDQRAVVIDHQQHARVLLDRGRVEEHAQVVGRPLGLAGDRGLHPPVGVGPRYVPAVSREQERREQQQRRQRQSPQPGLADIAPAACQEICRSPPDHAAPLRRPGAGVSRRASRPPIRRETRHSCPPQNATPSPRICAMRCGVASIPLCDRAFAVHNPAWSRAQGKGRPMAVSDHVDFPTFMEGVKRRNPHQPEFVQAVQEVAGDIFDFIPGKEAYHSEQILRRMSEPHRVVSFRVCWEDDNGRIRVQRGCRVQNNNAIGPYKGGIRFHPSVNESVLKFLAFEQTFKNALTGLPMGGGKGGANFDPKGKSEREIMRFCQSFMTELYRHIGPDVDVPAGDIGVGAREIGYMFGQYKRITNHFNGVLTGKGLEYGGSLIRPEATGYGAVYFLENMLRHQGRELEGLTAVISGSGNVATFAAEKLIPLGAKPVPFSDSGGFIHDPEGITLEKVQWVKEHKTHRRGRISEYAEAFRGATFHAGQTPWNVPCEVALPCATQNELLGPDARALVANGCIAV